MSRVYQNVIENPEAYEAAIKRRIADNSKKTNYNWINEGDNRAVVEFLEKNTRNDFYSKMLDHYETYLKLSDGQVNAIRKGMEKKAAFVAARAANSTSAHVGEIGARIVFNLTIEHIVTFKTNFSYYGETCYIYICADEHGNKIVYKGSKEFTFDGESGAIVSAIAGDKVTGKASIKAHETREGIRQTIVTRPKFAVCRPA